MTVLVSPIDWGAIYARLYQWANGATGLSTVWADQNAMRPDYPYILLDVISEKRLGGVPEKHHSVNLLRARDVKILITARDLTTYTVIVNGNSYQFVSGVGATVAQISAGLKAQIDLGGENVTVTDNATDLDIKGVPETLNPSVPQIFNIDVADDFDGTLLSRANNDAGNEVELKAVSRHEFTVNVQAFVRSTVGDNEASDPDRNAFQYAATLKASLGLPTVQASLRGVNVAIVEDMGISDLSEALDDRFISRASFDLRLRTVGSIVEYVGYIDTVSGQQTVTPPGQSPIIENYSVSS